MKFINKYKSSNYNLRKKNTLIKYIIIHYTAMRSYNEALDHLCSKESQVSSHFLINKDGKIYNLVDLKFRAWHAGESFWLKDKDINSYSIGIEIDNSGHLLDFEQYKKHQKISLIKLLIFLKKKFNINKHSILGHSDIAPYRKIDPGEKFPWITLQRNNLVFLPIKKTSIESLKIEKFLNSKKLKTKKTKTLYMLSCIGYDVSKAKKSFLYYVQLIKIYQMRYKCKKVSGILDMATYELIKAHFNELLTI